MVCSIKFIFKRYGRHMLERYITEHSEAQFSYGICPDCFEKEMKKLQSSS